ncbi:transporter [Rhodoferax lacus]|uniref:Transporter n=1 Tax=Rhodoferax lacus TaxID=2184758 RepID=A0A3E1RF91_9BURK|nr:TIM44-like domain-containing protein [Rhodoferax lacus]RFO98046.1 transporter [Rhodoferax lacus]
MKWSVSAVVLTLALALGGVNAEAAKRLGGGGSFGKQSSNVTQRSTAPAAPGAPAQSATNAAKPAPAVAPAPARRPWGAMLGGLAAGLGLAWLASSLGMGEAFGQILMFGLLALGVMMLVGFIMRKRNAAPAAAQRSPFAFQGAGGAPVPQAYRPENVGNDASARPFERSNLTPIESGAGGSSMIGSALQGSQNWGVPAGFDSEGFLRAAKGNFVTLQAAWDRSDIPALRAMMTDGMLGEIRTQLAEREAHTGTAPNSTEVVMIEAHLLGIEELADEYMASVEFSGMIREEPSAGPSPFREVWNMTKPKSGNSGWLVAGVQALQ